MVTFYFGSTSEPLSNEQGGDFVTLTQVSNTIALTASSNVAVGEILKFIDKLKFKKDES
jgi:hypothetical protein